MRLAIRSRGRIHLLNSAEIDWIEAADNYVNIHSGAHEYLMRESMKDIEARLAEGRFLRIHRCVIVNMDRVREVRTAPHGDSSCSIVLTGRDRLAAKPQPPRQDRTAHRGATAGDDVTLRLAELFPTADGATEPRAPASGVFLKPKTHSLALGAR